MSAANQRCNGNPQKLVVIYPAPGTGHLNSTVELGRLLVSHGLAVTIVVRGQQAGDVPVAAASSATGDASANPCLSFHCIPEVSLPSDAPEEGDHVAQVFALIRASNHELRDFLQAAIPTALLLDFFCGCALDVGAELGIPTYFFYTSCTASLAFLLYLPVIHGKTALSFRDLGRELVHVPGVPPIPVNDLPVALLDRSNPSYRHFLALSEQMCKSRGVIVNSCRSLEPRATDAVVSGLCTPPEHTTPPIYVMTHHHEYQSTPNPNDILPNQPTIQVFGDTIGRNWKQGWEEAIDWEEARTENQKKEYGERNGIGEEGAGCCLCSSMPARRFTLPSCIASPGHARWAKGQPTDLSNLEAHTKGSMSVTYLPR